MFIVLFLGYNNSVKAYTDLNCKIGEDNCTEENIRESIGASYDLVCLYEVTMNNGDQYYNYIIKGSTNYFGTSTIKDILSLSLGKKGSVAFLLGDAYDDFYDNKNCPLYSYIDTKGNKEVCFDNNGECKNGEKKYNNSTDFNSTKKLNTIIP